LIPTSTLMLTLVNKMTLTRRAALGGLATLPLVPTPVWAISEAAAKNLVGRLVGDINAVIGSGQSEAAMIREFETIFSRYADVPTIARSALGPTARSASRSELSAFTQAFQGYMARKYGKRFREFVGGKIEVQSAENRGKFYEVRSRAILRGSAPFEIAFRVSDRSGKDLFFDLLIEGISLLSSERVEIGALLDRAGGNLPKLTQDLSRLG